MGPPMSGSKDKKFSEKVKYFFRLRKKYLDIRLEKWYYSTIPVPLRYSKRDRTPELVWDLILSPTTHFHAPFVIGDWWLVTPSPVILLKNAWLRVTLVRQSSATPWRV